MTYNIKVLSALMVTMFLGLSLLVVTAYCEERYDKHEDLVAYGAIEYEGEFFEARLDDSSAVSEIIIDDKIYKPDAEIILRNEHGTLVSISGFQQGDMVSFFVVDEDVITKMWIAEDEGDDEDGDQEITTNKDSSNSSDELKLIDGVWTN